MKSKLILAIVAVGLNGCGQKEAQVSACKRPVLVQPADPASYGGQRDLAQYCVKLGAYDFAREGLPVAAAAAATLKRCAPNEAATIAALARTGPVYPYQRKEVDGDLAHLALVSVVRARSRGCGLANHAPDTLLDTRS